MLRLMSYNIRFGGRGREERIAAVIGQAAPDIVVLQEATDTRVVERLSKLTGLNYYATNRGHSVAFLSRTEPKAHAWRYHQNLQRAVLEIDLDGVRVFGVIYGDAF